MSDSGAVAIDEDISGPIDCFQQFWDGSRRERVEQLMVYQNVSSSLHRRLKENRRLKVPGSSPSGAIFYEAPSTAQDFPEPSSLWGSTLVPVLSNIKTATGCESNRQFSGDIPRWSYHNNNTGDGSFKTSSSCTLLLCCLLVALHQCSKPQTE